MNIDDTKLPKKRFVAVDVKNLGIQGYGEANNYPQRISQLLSSSTNAKTCASRYAKFVRGNGFADTTFYTSIVNSKGQTCDTLLRLCSEDLATYGGFALHINYNVLCEVVSVNHVPFEHCRLSMEDDNGYIATIAVHPDWTQESGKKSIKKPSKESVDYIDVFNPRKEVVAAQIERACIENYKGQVMYVTSAGDLEYPTPKYDSAVTDISTDEGLANVRCRNVRNNFLPSGMWVYPKPRLMEGEKAPAGGFDPEMFKQFQGDMNSCKIASVGLEEGDTPPQFVEFPTKNYDKDYTVTKEATVEEIYTAFGQEVFLRIRTGALGFSSDVVSDAFNFYNADTSDERNLMEQAFKAAFQRFAYPINQTNDYSLIPLKYAVDIIQQTTNNAK